MLRLSRGLRLAQCMAHCAPSSLSLHSRAHLAALSRPGPFSNSDTLLSHVRRWPVTLRPNPEITLWRCSTLAFAKRGRNKSVEAPAPMSREPKTCSTCGREITWRKKWERCWDDIKYCSDACRKNKPGREAETYDKMTCIASVYTTRKARVCLPANGTEKWRGECRDLENMIMEMLSQRKCGATICPSEVARKYYGEDNWRDKMETVRQAARRLVASEQIEITQKGKPVDPSRAKGPIRLRLV